MSNKRLSYLDGWRGLAILFVLVGHFYFSKDATSESFRVGRLGVELFFVLSGRLMADILFVKSFPLKQFYKRRISRIYPGLLVFGFITYWATHGTSYAFGKLPILAAVTFTFNYCTLFPWFYKPDMMGHLWSLCIEEHAYILLGIIAYFNRKMGLNAARVVFILAILSMLDGAISTWLFKSDYYATYWRSDAHISSIFIACSMYLWGRHNPVSGWITAMAFINGIIFSLPTFSDPIHYIVGTSFLALSISTLDYSPIAASLLSWRMLRWFGIASYSIYLWQQPFFNAVWLVDSPYLIVFGVTCGILSFALIETPARRWLNSHWN